MEIQVTLSRFKLIKHAAHCNIILATDLVVHFDVVTSTVWHNRWRCACNFVRNVKCIDVSDVWQHVFGSMYVLTAVDAWYSEEHDENINCCMVYWTFGFNRRVCISMLSDCALNASNTSECLQIFLSPCYLSCLARYLLFWHIATSL